MKKTALIFCLTLVFTQSILSAKDDRPELAADKISETLKKNAYAVIRENEVVFETKTPDKGTMTETITITILDEKGNHHANFRYPGDKYRTLATFSGQIFDAQGKIIRKLKKSEVQSSEWSPYLATGDIHYFLNVSTGSYPFTVSFRYSVDYKNGILMYPTFVPQGAADLAVEQSKYTLKVPVNTSVLSKPLNIIDLQKTGSDKTFDIYEIAVKNLAAFEGEPLMPGAHNFLPIILIRPQKFVFDNVSGEITDWKSLGSWQNKLWTDRDLLDDGTKQKVKELTANAATDREKTKILYEYLGKTTHYQNISLGIGGYQPMPAAEVSRVGFGDCKALCNYLHAMLKSIGIKSYITIIRAGKSEKNVFEDYANFTQFNHIILQVPLPDETLWLECTNTEVPFGFVHNSIAGHQALVLKENGGELVRLPDYPDNLNIDKNLSEITINTNGSADVKTQNISRAKAYDDFVFFTKRKTTEQVDVMRSMINLPNAVVRNVTFTDQKSPLPVLTVNMKWETSAYGTKTGSRLFLPVNPLRRGKYNLKKKERKFDIEILDGQLIEDSLALTIPENFVVEALPPPVNIQSSFGEFRSKITTENNKITIRQSFLMSSGTRKSESFSELSAFLETVNNAYNGKIIIKDSRN